MSRQHTKKTGIFATTKRGFSKTIDLLEATIDLASEELGTTLRQNRDENITDEFTNKIELLTELKDIQLTNKPSDKDLKELKDLAIKSIKANTRKGD